jgi:hypothetical protein
MAARDLTCRAMGDAMGVNEDRVKSLCSGKAKDIRREESEALIRNLGVSAKYLVTGEPPMFMTPGEMEMTESLGVLGDASRAAATLDISRERACLVMELLFYARVGNGTGARQALDALAGIDPDESALLEIFRTLSPQDKAAVVRTCAGLANVEVPPKLLPKSRRVIKRD